MLRKLIVLLATVVVLAATHARALGLGDITLESSLNQPLSARIELLQAGDVRVEDIQVAMAEADDFERFSLDRPYFLDSIRFNVRNAGPEGGNPYIELSSSRPVREPYLSFVLDTRWPRGRVLTEYTVLVDPPSFASAAAAQSPQPPVSTRFEQAPAAREPGAPDSARPAPRADSGAEPTPVPETDEAPVVADDPAPVQESAGTARFADTERTVPVQGEDTLWDIALQVRPDDTFSVQQTMLALQRLNPDAFINGNINLVRRGAVLRVPDAASIRELSGPEAIAEVGRQNRLFEDRRGNPASSEPLAPPPGDDEEQAPGEGELSVVSVDEESQNEPAATASADAAAGERLQELDERIETLEDEVAVGREEMDRVNRENRELDQRLSMLEEQIESAREVIRLRDLELAQLQESLSNGATTAPGPVDDGEGAGQPSAPTVTMAPDAPLPERVVNLLIGNPAALGAILALVVALLVLGLIRRNKAKQAELAEEHQEQDDEEELDFSRVGAASASEGEEESLGRRERAEAAMGEPAAGGESVERDLDDHEQTAAGNREDFESDDEAPVDEFPGFDNQGEQARISEEMGGLLAEVDALMEHRQYAEARQVLEDAIVAEPNRQELRLALLEVLVAQEDVETFRLQESELGDVSSVALQNRLRTLREKIRRLESGEEPESNAGDNEPQGEKEGKNNHINELRQEDEVELELDMESSAEVDDDKVRYGGKGTATTDDSRDSNRFADEANDEVELEAFDLEPGDEETVSGTAEPSGEGDVFEFDLDLELESGNEEESGSRATREPDEEFEFSLDDFALDDESGSASLETGPETGSTAESPVKDDENPEDVLKDPEMPYTDDEATGSADDTSVPAGTATSADEQEEDRGDDEFEFLSDTDEAATKLDLARAYIDMGDAEGAREILEEVIGEGTEDQVADARKLIERLD